MYEQDGNGNEDEEHFISNSVIKIFSDLFSRFCMNMMKIKNTLYLIRSLGFLVTDFLNLWYEQDEYEVDKDEKLCFFWACMKVGDEDMNINQDCQDQDLA